MVTLTPMTFLIVCPFLFLAGFMDSIAGGGGLISLPMYLIAGLPVHNAIATNKCSSTFGTTLTAARYIKHGMVSLYLAVPSVIAAILGSSLGARISLGTDEKILQNIMIVALPIVAFFVLNKKLFKDNGETTAHVDRRTVVISILAAFVIGVYDGLYGPGTGTFLIIAFTVFAKMGIGPANGQTKVINATTNWTALVIYFMSGNVILPLGIAAALCNIAGNYVGSSLAMKNGMAIVRPVIIVVLVLLFLKVLGLY